MAATAGKKRGKVSFAKEIDATVNSVSEEKIKNPQIENTKKNKGGRPSVGKVKKMPLAIPEELYEGVETGAALFFKGNKTAYINSLIKKDLEENLEKYKEFQMMAQNR